ncbi:MAG: hypothetical protein AABZ06_05515 [Bdellovibrionota bacterium]
MRIFSCFLIAGLLGGSVAFAAGTSDPSPTASPRPQSFQYGGGAADILNQTKTPESMKESAGGMKVSMTCTDVNGKQYNQGDADYLRCMEDYKSKKTGTGNTTDSKAAAGFNFKIK